MLGTTDTARGRGTRGATSGSAAVAGPDVGSRSPNGPTARRGRGATRGWVAGPGEGGRGREAAGSGGGERGRRGAGAVRRWTPVLGVGCAAFLFVEGAAGLVAGVLAGAGAWWAGRRVGPVVEGPDLTRVAGELPLAADLLGACVAAGAEPVSAARAVGDALGGPVGVCLARGAAEVRLGAGPDEAWRELAALPDGAELARLLERAGDSGAPASAPVARYAARARARWSRAATARARRAGVLVTAPVGLCFLPAFVVVGVLPVVVGLAGRLLAGGDG
ncbi:type II secretion system F family protein [Streptomyces uncialis]|uniref:type II secretion system F family protein n=1 Tax=Streptomyces uncialis TaxID=1048205 RepID=UPI003F4D5C6D